MLRRSRWTFVVASLAAQTLAEHGAAEEIRLQPSSYFGSVASQLRKAAFRCPNVTALFFVGEEHGRNHLRAVCGPLRAPDLAQIRIVAGGSGLYRAEPWSVPGQRSSLADAFYLRPAIE